MKGNVVTVSPPVIPTAKKHGEMKEICCDTAVSEHTTLTLQPQSLLCLDRLLAHTQHTVSHSLVRVLKHVPESAASSASYPLKPRYRFTLCSDSAHNTSPTFSLSTQAHAVVVLSPTLKGFNSILRRGACNTILSKVSLSLCTKMSEIMYDPADLFLIICQSKEQKMMERAGKKNPAATKEPAEWSKSYKERLTA